MVLPLEPTDVPGVYRRGSKFVVVYRAEGRQHKQAAETMADARVIKLQRDGEARGRGPTLHELSRRRPLLGAVTPLSAPAYAKTTEHDY